MLLVDQEIQIFLRNGTLPDQGQTAIYNGVPECVTNIGYDLRAKSFARAGHEEDSCELQPGESVFVTSEEIVKFDHHTVGKLALKNSRIRRGLTMDAPVYQPGHKTVVFFRLTNVSSNLVYLRKGEKYAMLMFEQLENAPEHPYQGAFRNEFSFQGLADYTSQYADQIKSLDGKINNLKSLEKSIYGNVVTILTIFIAIFTILNVNISLAETAATAKAFLIYNLATLGAISFLGVLMEELIHREGQRKHWLWLIPGICFLGVVTLALLP